MRRAKRWLLIFAALLGLMSHAGALRASSLFGKGPTTSTSTTTTTEIPETTAIAEEAETKAPVNTTSKPSKKLTGIPQIDWVWDPNLPRELNGYNLSSYPFFSTVPPPEEIKFRCDGLHDGFYASIEYKCQVYHHCVYGIRHDFLCANFTAFDQRTFICHFVSDVDCVHSEKFWSRNDNLYMATTTTSTTTTTTPAPITPEPEYRPRNRRPLRRRRPSDYYYDDEYEDDYYEEDRRMNRRRKQRPRKRRPTDYDDDYEERRSYSDADARPEKRPKNRDRVRDDTEEDYVDEHRARPRARPKAGAAARPSDIPERKKLVTGRRTPADRQASIDERRSLSEDKPRNRLDDPADVVEQRPLAGGRRRHNGGRRPAQIDDDYERPIRRDEVEDEEEKPVEPKVEKELVRPITSAVGSSPLASIFDRPRVAPKIARPVPVSEKRKFGYQGQKSTPSSTTASPLSDEYYDDEEYEDVSPVKDNPLPPEPVETKDPPRRRLQDDLNSRRSDDIPLRRAHSQSRRGSEESSRRPGRPFQRKPSEPIRKAVDDYDSIPVKDEPVEKFPLRKRPAAARDPIDDADPVEDDTRYYIKRPREPARRPLKKDDSVEDETRDQRRGNRRRPADPERVKPVPPPVDPVEESDELYDDKVEDTVDPLPDEKQTSTSEGEKPTREGRPVVRVVKRPFLPSRGGSPYLPRGLQPVGAALKQTTTDSTPIDMGSTISGVRLLEHGAPILRDNSDNAPTDFTQSTRKGPRTTLPPQVEYPKAALDELYENDYDVTLNDALNPTLKPLSSSNRNYLGPFNKYERGGYSAPGASYNNAGDSYYSSTDLRRRTVPAPRNTRQEFRGASRIAQHFYEDFEY